MPKLSDFYLLRGLESALKRGVLYLLNQASHSNLDSSAMFQKRKYLGKMP